MSVYNAEQIKTLVNSAYAEATGSEGVDSQLDLTKFTETGNPNFSDIREKFTKALLCAFTKRWYTDASYRSSYKDDFFVDANKWGAIISVVSVEAPEVKDNSAWKTFTSGSTTVGQYTVYLPVVSEKFYCSSVTWALPVTVTGQQWDTAVRGQEEFDEFIATIFLAVDNKLLEHMENLNNLNRANFIAEKIYYSAQSGAIGTHVVNFVQEYVTEKGITTGLTVADFLNDKDCINFMIEKIGLYKTFIQKQTSLFNTDHKVKFIPQDRFVLQMLSTVVERMITYDRSGNFRSELDRLPLYSEVASWQSLEDLSFDGVSAINVKTADGHTVNKTGIIGMMCDKWCIMHTIRSERVGSQYFGIEDISHYEYQHRDQYMNNLALNAVVFVLEDVASSTT